MEPNLLIRAGSKALAEIRAHGLRPEAIEVIAGAAGGPKWLVLNGLDRALFFDWFKPAARVFCIGSSIGAWRFAAIAQGLDAYARFEEAYIHQRYSAHPSAAEVTRESIRVRGEFLDASGVRTLLTHPHYRINMLTVRCRGPMRPEGHYALGAAVLMAGAANAVTRRALRLFFERTLLYDPRDLPPFFGMDTFSPRRVALSPENLADGLLASGSIPLVMEGVRDIAGAPRGVYRDGGLIDYHLDLPFGSRGLVLFPHYRARITPGWFDKHLSWRRPSAANMENVVLLCPSPAFVARLPYGKIPDRDDFLRLGDKDRITAWKTVVECSRILGEEFLNLVKGDIRRQVRPLDDRVHVD